MSSNLQNVNEQYSVLPIVNLAFLEEESVTGAYVSNALHIFGAFLYLVMTNFQRSHGSITSGTLTMYWVFNTACFWFYWTSVYQAQLNLLYDIGYVLLIHHSTAKECSRRQGVWKGQTFIFSFTRRVAQ